MTEPTPAPVEPEGPPANRPYTLQIVLHKAGAPTTFSNWKPDVPEGYTLSRLELLDEQGVPYLAVPFCRHGGGQIHSICIAGDEERIERVGASGLTAERPPA